MIKFYSKLHCYLTYQCSEGLLIQPLGPDERPKLLLHLGRDVGFARGAKVPGSIFFRPQPDQSGLGVAGGIGRFRREDGLVLETDLL